MTRVYKTVLALRGCAPEINIYVARCLQTNHCVVGLIQMIGVLDSRCAQRVRMRTSFICLESKYYVVVLLLLLSNSTPTNNKSATENELLLNRFILHHKTTVGWVLLCVVCLCLCVCGYIACFWPVISSCGQVFKALNSV